MRWRTAWGLRRSRERPAAPMAGETLGRQRRGQLAAEPEKRERGCKDATNDPWLPWTRNPEAGKPMEAHGAEAWPIPRSACGLRVVCESLEGRLRLLCRGETPRGAASERAYGTGRGARPRRAEPHERNRDGISPEGHEGSKASRGCETLRAQRNRRDGIRRG